VSGALGLIRPSHGCTYFKQIFLQFFFGKLVRSWSNPKGLFMFCLSRLFKAHGFHEMYILLKI
jgi:hypothetical protein